MAITDFTTTNSVRAVLGVSHKEIQDVVLLNPIYDLQLTEALFQLNADMQSDFETAFAIPEADRTSTQERFVGLVQLYAAYFVADLCLGAVEMFAPITIKDSKSELTRNDPYKTLRIDVPRSLAIIKISLMSVYALINPVALAPTAVQRISVLASPLATNPVTG